jgi:hypothetical protein
MSRRGVLVGPDGEPEPATAATVARHSDYHKAFVAFFLASTDGFATYGSFESTARAFAFEKVVFLGGKTEIERPSLPP